MLLLVSRPGIISQTWKRRDIKPSAEFITLDAHEKLYCQKRGLQPCVPALICFPCTFSFPYGTMNFLGKEIPTSLPWMKKECITFLLTFC